jgi:structural maintenance of chromosome 1
MGIVTFIPLDTIIAPVIKEQFRTLSNESRLALDVIQFDSSVQRAFQYACGNTIICDTLDVARDICYARGVEVKAVALDGTVIHKSGLITGGTVAAARTTRRQWGASQVEELRLAKERLTKQLQDLQIAKAGRQAEGLLNAEKEALRNRISLLQGDLGVHDRKLQTLNQNLAASEKSLAVYDKARRDRAAKVATIEADMSRIQHAIDAAADKLFSAFCKEIKVSNIREYENGLHASQKKHKDTLLQFAAQKTKISNQLRFEQEQLADVQSKLTKLEGTMQQDQNKINSIQMDKSALQLEYDEHTQALKRMQDDMQTVMTNLDKLKRSMDKCKQELEAHMTRLTTFDKDIGGKENELDRLNAERDTLLGRCKLEDIPLPLAHGSLDDIVSSDQHENAMDVDGGEANVSQLAMPSRDWPVRADFGSLTKKEKQDSSDEFASSLTTEIQQVDQQLETLAPNLRAINRIQNVDGKVKGTNDDYETAKTNEQQLKANYTRVKQKRHDHNPSTDLA